KSVGAVRLWEVATGKEVLEIAGGGSPVFSPDGRLVAADLGTAPDRPEAGPRVGVGGAASDKPGQGLRGFGPSGPALAVAPGGGGVGWGLVNGTVLVWDVSVAAQAARPRDLGPDDLNSLWADLAGDDAGRAWAAVFALTAAPEQSVPWLRGRLRPAAARE